MKKQAGFTLIELIIVIVILGILAVVAAPRFFNFSSDARSAVVKGMEGSLKSASELVHARYLIAGDSPATVETATGVSAAVVNQYAAATSAGIGNAVSADDFTIVPATAAQGDVEVSDLLFVPPGADNNADASGECYAVYRAATASTAPVIFSVTSGC